MPREMKETGIEWIGEVPKDWDIVKLKMFSNIKSGDFIDKASFIDDGEIEVYGANAKIGNYNKANLKKQAILTGRVGTIGTLNIRENVWITDNVLAIDIIKNELKYIYYYLHTVNFNDLSSSTAQPLITASKLGNVKIFVPPLEEQKKIADLLDKKCQEIEEIKETIESEIKTLDEYKKSIITEAVTKGLDKGAEMKDSGIEWIGQIPKHWSVIKGKYIFAQRNERGNIINLEQLSPTQEFGVIPQTLYEELSGMRAVKLNEKTDLNILKTIHKRDFCISLRSFQGGFEYSEYEGVVSPAYQVFYNIVEVCNTYYKYLFKEKSFIDKMNSYTMSLRDGKNISFNDFGKTKIPLPPINEQKAIAEYLDHKTGAINEAIEGKRAQLVALDEYKKSLIYEYVTGKKEA